MGLLRVQWGHLRKGSIWVSGEGIKKGVTGEEAEWALEYQGIIC
jgi:hypothetical protein